MGTTALGTFLKMFGGKFFSFLFPKIKNSKFFRDIKDKWVKDNYAQKTTLMFQAAIDNAKASLDLPEELVIKLLEDPVNRDEVFLWILKGAPENIDESSLNLEPYMESFPQYQDLLRPFFELISLSLNDYKTKHWEPEFLELISKIDNLEQITKTGFDKVIQKQSVTMELVQENNRYLKEVITPTEFNDLNDLIKSGKLIAAREKATERLKKINLKRNEILELHIIIANTYLESRDYDKAIQHLYTAITHCDHETRKKRLEALASLLQDRFEQALKTIEKAIEIEGESRENINILINILIKQEKFDEALKIIENQTEEDFELLKANIWLSSNEFEKTLDIANQKLSETPLDVDWLMLKAEASMLKLEHDIANNKAIYPERIFNEIMPLFEKIEKQVNENAGILHRVKELKAALYFRNNKHSEAKLILEEIFQSNKDFSSLIFANLLINCICSGDWEKAISLLEEKNSKQQLTEIDIVTLADAYIKAGQTEKAISILKINKPKFHINSKFPFSYYFSYIEALFSLLKHTEIRELITSVEQEINSITAINILKGYYAFKKHEWDNVINYLEPNIDKLEKDALIAVENCLTEAYLNRGTIEDYKKLKKIIIAIPNWIHHEILLNRYVQALFHLGEYENIIALNEQLPYKSIFLFDIITTIYFNLGWFDIAKENYLSLYQQTGKLEHQLRYANCLYRIGKITDCVDILSSAEIRVRKSGEIADYQLLCLAFIDVMEYRKAMEFAYLTFMAGKEHPKVWGFFFIQMSQLSQFVDNPDEKWIKEYQRIMEEFEEVFPDEEPLFKKIEVLEGDTLSTELIKELKHSTDAASYIKSALSDQKFPINFLVSRMNRGPFESWAHVVNEKDAYLWTISGFHKELFDGAMTACLSHNVLCDFTTLLTIQNLEFLETLNDNFQLYIHQEQFDAAFQEYTQNKLQMEKGLKFLSYKDGNVQMTEYTPEQLKDSLENQEELFAWINKHCIKLGNPINNNHRKDDEDDNLAFLNHPLKICKNNKLTMLIDSLLVKGYAQTYHEVNCFSTLDFINLLFAQKIIDNGMKNKYIGKLLMMGHVLVPVNAEVFIYYLKESNYKITYEVSLLFDYLKFKYFNEEFLVNVIGEILSWIWTENISSDDRRILTERLCATISVNRSESVVLSNLIEHSKAHFHSSHEEQWIKMSECIETLLKKK
ncbi:tetratricopeptide repeat protein [Bacillus pseudomycoides]|uniref:tetratricopeptide repeat protein n=1 Tax=Bacillus pseudomycoides TaxID=64104 RepID=UPI003D661F4E